MKTFILLSFLALSLVGCEAESVNASKSISKEASINNDFTLNILSGKYRRTDEGNTWKTMSGAYSYKKIVFDYDAKSITTTYTNGNSYTDDGLVVVGKTLIKETADGSHVYKEVMDFTDNKNVTLNMFEDNVLFEEQVFICE